MLFDVVYLQFLVCVVSVPLPLLIEVPCCYYAQRLRCFGCSSMLIVQLALKLSLAILHTLSIIELHLA